MAPTLSFKPKQEWRCPQGPPETSTTYNLSYMQNWELPKSELIKPVSDFKLFGDECDYFDNNTVYRNSYQNVEKAERAEPITHMSNLCTSKDRPESNTVYKMSFLPNTYNERSAPIVPKSNMNWKANEPMESITTQKDDFVEKPFCKRDPIAQRESHLRLSGPVECGTVYNLSYVPIRAERVQSFKPVNQYEKPAGIIDIGTTYKLSYTPNNVTNERPFPIKPTSNFSLFGNGQLDLGTIYKNSYQTVHGEKVSPIKHTNNLSGSKDRPESSTVYKLSYAPCDGYERSHLIIPSGNLLLSGAPMQNTTTQKLDYVELPFSKRDPIQHRENEWRPQGPTEKGTVYKLSYMPVTGDIRRRPFKPVNQYEKVTGKAETSTTYNLSYIPNEFEWGVRADPIKPTSNFKLGNPKEWADYSTIYRNSYNPVEGIRTQPIKHMENLTTSGAPFEGNTIYKMSYVPSEMHERTQPFKPTENSWSKPNQPFEGYTTTKLDYIPHPFSKRDSVRHTDNQLRLTGEMDQRTVYNLSYMPVRGEMTRPIKQTSQYEKPILPLETNTTYNQTFVHHVPPDKDPMPWAYQSSWERPIMPMDTMTVHKLSYMSPCAVQT